MPPGSNKYTLSVILSAIDKISAPAKKAGAALRRMEEPIQAVGRRMKALGERTKALGDKLRTFGRRAFLGVGVMATAATAGILKFTSAADRIGKTAARLQISTDALQKWSFGAEQSGMKAEEFTLSLERFTRAIGEAGKGTAQYKETFDDLGISLYDGEGNLKSNTDLFQEFADAIAEVEDPSKKMQMVMAVFGRSGGKMLNLLKSGSAGLKEYGDRLERLGGVLSSRTIKQSEAFNDSLNRLKHGITGMVSSLMGDLLPALLRITANVQRWIETNRDLIGQKIQEFFKIAAATAKGFWEGVKDIYSAIKSVIEVLSKFTGGITENTDKMKMFETIGKILAGVIGVGLVGALVSATGAVWGLTGALLANPIGLVIAAIAGLITAGILLVKNWDKVKAKFLSIWKTISGFFSKVYHAGANFVKGFWEGVKSAWGGFKSWLVDKFIALVSSIPGGTWLMDKMTGGSFSKAKNLFESQRQGGAGTTMTAKPLPLGASSKFQGKMQVEFVNAPPGTRIKGVETSGDADVDVDAGLTFGMA